MQVVLYNGCKTVVVAVAVKGKGKRKGRVFI